jgi:hypothetical protein
LQASAGIKKTRKNKEEDKYCHNSPIALTMPERGRLLSGSQGSDMNRW